MKKAILTALIISLMLIGCAIAEGSGSNSAEIDQAQQESVLKAYQSSETTQTATKDKNPDYIIILDQDSLRVRKADTKEIIFVGSWEEKTQLNEAIFRDNL